MDSDSDATPAVRPTPVPGSGRLEGYQTLPGWDPFEDIVGPMYEGLIAGQRRCAIELQKRHCNTAGIAHGGLMMTFADYATFAIAREELGGPGGATVSMNHDFCAPARAGDCLEAEAEVMRETRSMLFMRGRLFVGETTVMSFSTVIRKPRPKATPSI
ncbi:MAG: acyl-coenzyme A thioesterase 13 [Gammaproteobacteria bacterium]|jgi:acyl-coenzyme A thioesterase 13